MGEPDKSRCKLLLLLLSETPFLLGEIPLLLGVNKPLLLGGPPVLLGDRPFLLGDTPVLIGETPSLLARMGVGKVPWPLKLPIGPKRGRVELLSSLP